MVQGESKIEFQGDPASRSSSAGEAGEDKGHKMGKLGGAVHLNSSIGRVKEEFRAVKELGSTVSFLLAPRLRLLALGARGVKRDVWDRLRYPAGLEKEWEDEVKGIGWLAGMGGGGGGHCCVWVGRGVRRGGKIRWDGGREEGGGDEVGHGGRWKGVGEGGAGEGGKGRRAGVGGGGKGGGWGGRGRGWGGGEGGEGGLV